MRLSAAESLEQHLQTCRVGGSSRAPTLYSDSLDLSAFQNKQRPVSKLPQTAEFFHQSRGHQFVPPQGGIEDTDVLY